MDDIKQVGSIKKVYSYKGYVLVEWLFNKLEISEEVDFFFLIIDKKPVPFFVEDYFMKGHRLAVKFEDVDDENFARQIKTLISKWTGRIWNVILSDNKTGKTLAEEDVIRKQKLLEEINNYPEIKKILSTFPGSNIHSIEKEGHSDNQKNKMKILKQEKK